MDYETKLLEREQLGKKQGMQRGRQQGMQQKALKMTRNTIEQLKAAGLNDQEVYSFIKKLDTGLSDGTLHNMVDQYYSLSH